MRLIDKLKKIKNLFVKEKVVVKEVVVEKPVIVEKPVVLKPSRVTYSVIVMKGRYGIVRELYGRDRAVVDGAVVVQSPDGTIRVRFRGKPVSSIIRKLIVMGAKITKVEVHVVYENNLLTHSYNQ